MSCIINDFVSLKLEYLSEYLARDSREYRKAFAAHLKEVSRAIQYIKAVDNGEYVEEGDKEIIMKCISDQNIFKTLVVEAELIKNELQVLLKNQKASA
jgi:hypothetical protein